MLELLKKISLGIAILLVILIMAQSFELKLKILLSTTVYNFLTVATLLLEYFQNKIIITNYLKEATSGVKITNTKK